VEWESLRLLLSLTPWIQTDPLPDVVERIGWSSFRMAVWPTLACVPTARSVAARQPCFRFQDAEQQIPRIQCGTAWYMNCPPQSEAN
jgi:hypothetical protein